MAPPMGSPSSLCAGLGGFSAAGWAGRGREALLWAGALRRLEQRWPGAELGVSRHKRELAHAG